MNLVNRAKRYFQRAHSRRLLFQLKHNEFKNDPLYDLGLVQAGFANRPSESKDDTEVLERIIAAYAKAKDAQKFVDPNYMVSNEWRPIYESSLGPVMKALAEKNIPELRNIYQNFWRNSASVGLVGLPVNMENAYFGKNISKKNKKLFLFDMLHRIKSWKNNLGKSYSIKDLQSPDIGNPYGLFIDGQFIKSGADYLHYYSVAISRLIQSKSTPTVLELGGGYGGLAYYLCRDNEKVRYLDFDLPENLSLASYYLLMAFPEKRIALFGEIEIEPEIIRNYDIVLMPNFEIEKVALESVDLVFNSYSLAEMSPSAISNYVDIFHKITTKYIFHINHTRNSVLSADDFKIENTKFHLLYKVPAVWNGGRDLQMDEFEYLYTRS